MDRTVNLLGRLFASSDRDDGEQPQQQQQGTASARSGGGPSSSASNNPQQRQSQPAAAAHPFFNDLFGSVRDFAASQFEADTEAAIRASLGGSGQGGHQQERSPTATPPACRSAVQQLPMIRIAPMDLCDPVNRECCICLNDNVLDQVVVRLPCAHLFHSECIVPWLLQQSCTCPVCRYELPTDDAAFEQSRLDRMRHRKPRFARHELERLSVAKLKALWTNSNCKQQRQQQQQQHRQVILEKSDLVQQLIDWNVVELIPSPEPVRYTRRELQSMTTSQLVKCMHQAGVFYYDRDVVEKGDLLYIFDKSGRLDIIEEDEEEESETRMQEEVEQEQFAHVEEEDSKPPAVAEPRRVVIETVNENDDSDAEEHYDTNNNSNSSHNNVDRRTDPTILMEENSDFKIAVNENGVVAAEDAPDAAPAPAPAAAAAAAPTTTTTTTTISISTTASACSMRMVGDDEHETAPCITTTTTAMSSSSLMKDAPTIPAMQPTTTTTTTATQAAESSSSSSVVVESSSSMAAVSPKESAAAADDDAANTEEPTTTATTDVDATTTFLHATTTAAEEEVELDDVDSETRRKRKRLRMVNNNNDDDDDDDDDATACACTIPSSSVAVAAAFTSTSNIMQEEAGGEHESSSPSSPQGSVLDRFASLSIGELRQLARSLSVDLTNCIERQDMIDRLSNTSTCGSSSNSSRSCASTRSTVQNDDDNAADATPTTTTQQQETNNNNNSTALLFEMSVGELRTLAAAIDVDLSQCSSRDDMAHTMHAATADRPHAGEYLATLVPLVGLTVSQLRAVARERQLDVSDCLEKGELLQRLLTSIVMASSSSSSSSSNHHHGRSGTQRSS